jgi:hypothetical protein
MASMRLTPVDPPSPRRLHALTPWRAPRLADLRADEELRRRVVLAEERLADLKAGLTQVTYLSLTGCGPICDMPAISAKRVRHSSARLPQGITRKRVD